MLSLIALAAAGDVVIYGHGEPAAAAARVAAATGVAAADFRVTAVGEVLATTGPLLVGGGSLTACDGPATQVAALQKTVDIAKGAVAYMEYGAARAALEAAIRDLGCLAEPVAPELAARMHFLLGVVLNAGGDAAQARAAFRQARIYQPGIQWDPNFAPQARPLFEAAAGDLASGAPVTLALVPPATALRMDGVPLADGAAEVPLSPGRHLVQSGTSPVRTWTLDVPAGGALSLVLPDRVGAEALNWAGDGERRAALASIIVGSLGADGVIYVVTADAIWRLRGGGATWDFVGAGTDKVVKKAGIRGGTLLAAGGAAVLVGGGVVAGIGFAGASEAYKDAEANGRSADGDAAYEAGGQLYGAGLVVAGAGALALGTGLVLNAAIPVSFGVGPGSFSISGAW